MTYAPEYNKANAWRMVMHCDCGRLFDDPSEWTKHQLKGEVDDYWSSGLKYFESYDGYYGDYGYYGDPYDMDYYYGDPYDDDYDGEFAEGNPLMFDPDDEDDEGKDVPGLPAWCVIAQAKHQQGKVRRSRQRKDTLGKYRGDDAGKAQPPCYRRDRHEVLGGPRQRLGKEDRRIANRKMRQAIRQGR